ncbi:uncharacterized protein LOC134206211 [Armigeres subalbatus]|uniref:uncharacterized protein LOC134206211 n=1 Tax=Armigeres subalbatus TaxID=124917 RepID=UPI002ED1FFEB
MPRKPPLDDSYYLCESCHESPSADRGMVACDECGKWFHYACANVDESIEKHPWCCERCLSARSQRHRGGSSTSSRRRSMALELQRLEEEYALQQEYMHKRYEMMASFLEDEEENDSHRSQHRCVRNVDYGGRYTDNASNHTLVNTVAQSTPNIGPTAVQISARQVWPKKLPVFTGAAEEWPIFISSYENSNAACGFSDVENLIRLQESLKGPALEIVRSRLLLPANVPKVIETLRRVYGKPEILIRSLISKVRAIDPPKSDRLDSIIKFGIAVQQLCDHLEAANQQDHLRNPVLLEEMVEKLPANFKLEWVRFKKSKEHVSIRTFGNFMENLVDEASEVTLLNAPSESMVKQEKKASVKQKRFLLSHSGPNATPEGDTKSDKMRDEKPCATCSKVGHRARNCEEFKKLKPIERLQLVRNRKLCAVCLYSHGSMRCRNKMLCNVQGCHGKHHALLHNADEPEEANCMVHQRSAKSSVVFRVVPVTLTNGACELATYAFLDEGSSKTLLEKSVATKLGLKGTVRPLDLTWTSGVTRTEKTSMNVRLMVSSRESNQRYLLTDVHTVERLNLPRQSVNFNKLVSRFDHLQGLFVEEQNDAEPTILIGLDNLDLMVPLESRIGGTGEPVGLRCKLGWTISGPVASIASDGFCGVHQCDVSLDQALRNYFTIEEAGITCPYRVESDEDRRARVILEQTTKRVGTRFETGLLWRNDEVRLPNSYSMAYRRMQSLEQRFKKDPELQHKIACTIDDFVKKGYAHKATANELSSSEIGREWYLPLNVVVNAKKPG